MSLIKFIIKRVFALIPILIGALFLSFWLSTELPGNPFLYAAAGSGRWSDTQQDLMERNMALLGFDGSHGILYMFGRYLLNILRGTWGDSISLQQGYGVWELIGHNLPITLELTLSSVILSSIIGINVGKISAVNRNKWKDTIIRFIALMGVAIPIFWFGLMLQYVFAAKLRLLPGTNYQSPSNDPINVVITTLPSIDAILNGQFDIFFDIVLHMILPVFTLTFVTIAGITRQTRSSMLEVLELDYIRTARAKGAPEKAVINKHAFTNARIPVITIIGLNFAGLLGGAVLTETTFNLNGMGRLLIDAINAVDYFVINACVFYITIIFVIANLAIDVLYGVMDPRIRY